MVSETQSAWTLPELAARAALALSGASDQPPGRVREVPDLRSIRYYTTLGLLDRPAGFQGRTALYGKRHLAQLVAIKRLQAQGHALAQVQRTLGAMDEAELFQLAALPEDALADAAPASKSEAPPPALERGDFWKASPAQIAEPPPALKAQPGLQSVALDPQVLLVLPASRALDATDLEALRAAAAPLVKLLQKRGLLKPSDPEEK